jgi:hypothetical protein
MKSAFRALLAAPFCAAALVGACSSESNPPGGTTTPDSGTGSEGGADTSTPSDAGTDTSVPDAGSDGACAPYTGALPNDAGAQCHDLVSGAARITVISDPGGLPVGTGGTLGDGLYYLTEARIFPGSPVPAGTTLKYAVLIAGDMSYFVDDNNPAETVRRTTKKNPDGGAGIILCETKTDNNPSAGSQTATCTGFTSFDSNSKFSTKFVKQ